MFDFMAFEPSAHLSLSLPDINVGAHVGAPPGSPLLGINDWVPDSWENWYYGRIDGGGGLWFDYLEHGVWAAWDANGRQVDFFYETTQANATRTLTVDNSIGYDSTSRSGGGVVYLRHD
jgi:hypothetical protein